MNVDKKSSVIRGYQISAMAMACEGIVRGRKGACLALLRAVSLESASVRTKAVPAGKPEAKPRTQLQD